MLTNIVIITNVAYSRSYVTLNLRKKCQTIDRVQKQNFMKIDENMKVFENLKVKTLSL